MTDISDRRDRTTEPADEVLTLYLPRWPSATSSEKYFIQLSSKFEFYFCAGVLKIFVLGLRKVFEHHFSYRHYETLQNIRKEKLMPTTDEEEQ